MSERDSTSTLSPVPRVARWMIDHRLLLLCFGVAVTVLALPVSWRIGYDRSVRSLFPKHHPRLLAYQSVVDDFGGDAVCLAAYTDPELLTAPGLARLQTFANALERVVGVRGVSCLAEQPRPGDRSWWQSMGWRLLGPPNPSAAGANSSAKPWKTLAEWFAEPNVDLETLRREVLQSELYANQLVGADGQTAAVVVLVDREDMAQGAVFQRTLDGLRAVCAAHPFVATVVGSPVMINDVYASIDQDAKVLTRVAILTMLGVIFVLFRNLRWVLLPLAIVEATLIWTRALMAASHIELSIIGSMMTALVTVIGMATTIHVAVRYREEFACDGDPIAALERTFTKVMMAVFWTCATTACGFGSLAVSDVAPVRNFAFVMASASIFVGLASFLFLPAGVLLGHFRHVPRPTPGEATLADGLGRAVSFIGLHSFLAALATLALLAGAAVGFRWLEVETDFTRNFRANSEILRGYRFVEDRLGGAGLIELVFETPERLTGPFLDRVRRMEEEVRQIPGVAKVTGLPDVLDFFEHSVPLASGGLGRLLGQDRVVDVVLGGLKSLAPEILARFWNADRRRMLVQIRVREQQSVQGKAQQLDDIVARARAAVGPSADVSGLYVMLVFLIDNLLRDQTWSFAISAAGILVMTAVAFRSPSLGLVGFLPNLVPIIVVVGAMGWLGIKVNVATAMIGSISMGLVVDFSIHYLNRFRQEEAGGADFATALWRSHRSTGKAMVFANLALMLGFSVLVLSQFVPTIHFGLLVSVAILGGLLGNLVLVPVLLRLVRRQ